MKQETFYNQEILWNFDYLEDPINKERFMDVIKHIPDSVTSVLDVGCGNGSFLNYLESLKRYNRLAGIDFSEEALKHVKTENIKGVTSKLPFNDKEFDLVTCLEVLEHLSIDEFKQTLEEIVRVSKKYIIISVPNNEDLEKSLVKCPYCQCRYSPNYHKRSFNKSNLESLFIGTENLTIIECGPILKYRKLSPIIKVLSQAVKVRIQPETSYCPQCGYNLLSSGLDNSHLDKNYRFFLVKYILKAFHIFFRLQSKKRWFLSLYRISDS